MLGSGLPSNVGRAAIVGVGTTPLYRRGTSERTEFQLLLDAARAACGAAGIRTRDIDGFSTFADDGTDPGRLASALGVTTLTWSTMQWGFGGGGAGAAVVNAAMAVSAGLAQNVLVFRAIHQGRMGRFGHGGRKAARRTVTGYDYLYGAGVAPHGVLGPVHTYALRASAYLHAKPTHAQLLEDFALTCNDQAQRNPSAVRHGKSLSSEAYRSSRYIAEPLRLYDCGQETDGAVALVVCPLPRAATLAERPAVVAGWAQHGPRGSALAVENRPPEIGEGITGLAATLEAQTGVKPSSVDVIQVYDHFTSAAVTALDELGVLDVDEAGNPTLPRGIALNTSGGHLAEGYVHGLTLVAEAARQVLGQSPNQVVGCTTSLYVGPASTPFTGLVLLSA